MLYAKKIGCYNVVILLQLNSERSAVKTKVLKQKDLDDNKFIDAIMELIQEKTGKVQTDEEVKRWVAFSILYH